MSNPDESTVLALAAQLEGCRCTSTDRGTDTVGCDVHVDRQWDLDHPGGVISADEELAMAEYSMEHAL